MLLCVILGLLALLAPAEAVKFYKSANFVLVKTRRRRRGIRWRRGQSFCRSRFRTNLATVDSAEKQAELRKLLEDNGVKSNRYRAWIGANDARDEGKWKWRNGKAVSYANWLPGQPNNWRNQDCAEILPGSAYKWSDISCTYKSTFTFICDLPDPHVEGEHYTFVREKLSWDDANAYCKKNFDSHLATVEDATQSEHLSQLIYKHAREHSRRNVWIGLDGNDKPGEWKWVNDKDVCYGNWAMGEGQGMAELGCGAVYRKMWQPRKCSNKNAFVCQNGDEDDDVDDEDCDCDGQGNDCDKPNWAIQKAGLYWAWASPCGGACSEPVLKYGWRYATEAEWKNLPSKEEFFRDLPESEWCAAKIFDPKYNHCDERDPVIRVPDNSNRDLVLVHDGCKPAKKDCGDCDGQGNACDVPKWSVKKNGLFWAWASPCSGRCSQAKLLYGWRYATEEEWKGVPSKEEFFRDLPESEWCAAKVFDPKYNHCDERNNLVRVPDNSYNEQVLVHDDCGAGGGGGGDDKPKNCDCDGKGNDCGANKWAVDKGGLWWAWASPCSGGCSQAQLLYGWRYASAAEWANVPSKEEFYRNLPESEWCAAKIFDPKYNHCDEVNKLVRVPDGSYNEQVLVHDKCGGCQCAQDKACEDTGYAHYDAKTKLYWAWASPCSGGCSKLKDPIPFGWRRATAAEFAAKGFKCDEAGLKFFGYNKAWNDGADGQQIKSAEYPDTCAANVFDAKYTHCDAVNFKDGKCTYKEEKTYYETLIVHDSDPAKCKAAQMDASLWYALAEPEMASYDDATETMGDEFPQSETSF